MMLLDLYGVGERKKENPKMQVIMSSRAGKIMSRGYKLKNLFTDGGRCRLSTVYGVPTISEKVSVWNRTLCEAEEIIGKGKLMTQIDIFTLLANNNNGNLTALFNKVLASQHPIAAHLKNLFYENRLNFQLRAIVTLLLSRTAGHTFVSEDYSEAKKTEWISTRQINLASIAEMIHTAFLIHRSILNLNTDVFAISSVENQSEITMLSELQTINGIGVLGGDYVFAKACVGLGQLRNSRVLKSMSIGISDFVNGVFYGDTDTHGNPLPAEKNPGSEWEAKINLLAGSLLARSCESAMELGGHNSDVQQIAFVFGKYLGLALQVSNELQPFLHGNSKHPDGTPFNICSAPVVLYLEQHPELMEYIWREGKRDINNLDFAKIRQACVQGEGVERAKALLSVYAKQAESKLTEFDKSPARDVLHRLVDSLRE